MKKITSYGRIASRFFAVLFLVAISSQALFADRDIENAKKYLKNQIKETDSIFVSQNNQNIVNADIIKSRIDFDLGEGFSSGISSACFFKHKGDLKMFDIESDLICSPDFLKALNSKFKLKTDDDIENFRNLLNKIDGSLRGVVFQEKNNICFVIRKSFDDVSYYEVKTKSNGRIESIKYIEKKMDIPSDVKIFDLEWVNVKEANKNDKNKIAKLMKKTLPNCSFKLIKLKIPKLGKNIKVYDGKFIVRYAEAEFSYESTHEFTLVEKNNKYTIIDSKEKLLENEDFKRAIISSYSIMSKEQAMAFEKMLDEIKAGDSFQKKHFKKGNAWCFVRDESFGDLTGFLVIVDASGRIINIERSTEINASEIKQAELRASNLPPDFAFTLVKPSSTEVTAKAGKNIPVEISFNSDAVNAKSAYILTNIDGFQDGMLIDSNMKSPFKDEIPTDYLIKQYGNIESIIKKYGKGVHIIEYVLVVDQEPFETIRIKVTIK